MHRFMKLYEEYEYKKDSEFNKLTPKINSQKIVIISTPNNSNFIQRKVYEQKNEIKKDYFK